MDILFGKDWHGILRKCESEEFPIIHSIITEVYDVIMSFPWEHMDEIVEERIYPAYRRYDRRKSHMEPFGFYVPVCLYEPLVSSVNAKGVYRKCLKPTFVYDYDRDGEIVKMDWIDRGKGIHICRGKIHWYLSYLLKYGSTSEIGDVRTIHLLECDEHGYEKYGISVCWDVKREGLVHAYMSNVEERSAGTIVRGLTKLKTIGKFDPHAEHKPRGTCSKYSCIEKLNESGEWITENEEEHYFYKRYTQEDLDMFDKYSLIGKYIDPEGDEARRTEIQKNIW